MSSDRTLPAARRLPFAAYVLSLLVATAVLPGTARAQEEDQAPPELVLEAVAIEPAAPAADTLCRLTVKVRNPGEKTASQLDFKVRINGQELPVYRNQLFMYPVAPGETADIRLYNFWSTETSRPMPADGKLIVEVSLVEAQWMEIADDAEGVEVWTPLGAVPGLPSTASTTLQLKTGA